MSPLDPTGAALETLQGDLERRIQQRTFGRIHRLEVGVVPGRVSVRGYATSYYVKQLAIQAVLEGLGCDEFPEVLLEIEVGPAQPARNGPRDYQLARITDGTR
jgi:hypothetical protein